MNRSLEAGIARTWSGRFSLVVLLLLGPILMNGAETLKQARITQVIKEVKLLSGQGARPAAVNDTVTAGLAVRTGTDSRTELTFTDLTITRLGANTVFSFNEAERQVNLDSGAILLSVPRNGAPARIRTAVASAAISGGTALFEYHKGIPAKLYVLEGNALFCSKATGECTPVKGGETATIDTNGHISAPVEFNLARLFETSLLITDFPPLPNADLIQQVITQQQSNQSLAPAANTGWSSVIDIVDQGTAAISSSNPSSPPGGPPSKFGPLNTITSPNPYLITAGTQIQTDPTITTNGVTDFGKIYRGPSQDGQPANYFFGSTSSFDTSSGINQIFATPAYVPFATFKFTNLLIEGDPTISLGSGGATSLAMIGVNGLTTGAPGGSLTFAGIHTLLLATQNGTVTLTNNVSFSNLNNFFLYARGSGSNLTVGSAITGISGALIADAEGNVDVENNITTGSFISDAGVNFGVGSGNIRANIIQISAGNTLSFPLNNFAVGTNSVAQVRLNGGTAVTINATGDQSVFNNAALIAVNAPTITLTGGDRTILNIGPNASVTFTAGTGGIQASTVGFSGTVLTLNSGGDINIDSATTAVDQSQNHILVGAVNATGSLTATGAVDSGSVSTGAAMNIGGQLLAGSINAGTNITAASDIEAFGGSIVAGGNITSTGGTIQLQQNPPGTFGNITAGGNISAAGGLFTPGDPVVVMAGGSISAPGIITGTLKAGTNITIDNSGGSFAFGIVANRIMAGGTLNVINSPTISPNNGGSAGNDGETFNDFFMTVGSISSTGPTFPILSSNGGNANPNISNSNPGNGGNISLTTTIGGLTIGNAQDLDSILANGGAYQASGPFGGGNGGKIDIMSAGDVVITAPNSGGPAISASTGIVANDTTTFAGNGGTVNITSTAGAITINGTVQVSNDDQRIPNNNGVGRESASGGTIDLQSDLTTGTGITVGANGVLASYLNLNALNAGGTPGSITLSTLGADIVVNGTVRADFGTLTLNQNGPAGATPTITIDGGTVQAATFNINGSGDLTIGPNNSTAINIFGGTWNVAHDITLNAANTTFAFSFALNATAGNAINFTGGSANAPATLTLPLSGDTTFTAGAGGINAPFVAITNSGANLNLISAGSITAYSITHPGSASGTIAANGGALTLTGDLTSGGVSALTNIDIGGNVIVGTLTATNGTITVGGSLGVFGAITAGSDITAGRVEVSAGGITTPGNVTAGSGGIHPFIVIPGGATQQNFVTANTVISPNGIDFSGNQFGGIDGHTSGGILTLNVSSANFDPASGIGNVNFNGADAGATDFSGNVFTTVGGDGGTFIVNATGNITVNSGSPISASSGLIDPNLSNATSSGAGGTVTLNSANGAVSVDSTIQVSSVDPTSTTAPFRSSASGGNISLTSGETSGVAINISSNAQLLSLLNSVAPGPGGQITLLASGQTGSNAAINIDNSNGLMEVDRGTIDVRNLGDIGTITINNANLRADTIKIAALGSNGTLTIGGGQINADTLLHLYAPGSNGTIDFVANITLGGAAAKIIAGATINIFSNVVVTIAGSTPAQIYTNNANYAGFGGNGSLSGTFGGAGANNPQPLSSAPPFGSAPAVSGSVTSSSGSTVAGNAQTSPAQATGTIRVTNSSQLLSMLEKTAPGRDGQLTIVMPAAQSRQSKGVAVVAERTSQNTALTKASIAREDSQSPVPH